MAAMLAPAALRRRPLAITSHGLHRLRRSDGAAGWLVRRRLRTAVAASARTICIARDERVDLAAALPASLHDRLVLVANGVPLPPPPDLAERARTRAALGLEEGDLAVLFVGQLETRKDPLGAIAAVEAARLARRRGGAADRRRRPAGGRGRRPGRAPACGCSGSATTSARLYDAADLFLLPSHREGMSFALLEAMAHGLAPVVADGTGNAETIGDAGRLFPPGDIGAMSELLVSLAADPLARGRLGAAARERIRGTLSLERFLAGTREQYEAILEAP